MNVDNKEKMERRVQRMYKILNVIYYGAIVYLIILILINIGAIFMPVERFKISKGVRFWAISFNVTPVHSLGIDVHIKHLPEVSIGMPDAKRAYLMFSFVLVLIVIPAIIYGIGQIRNILFSMINDDTPFKEENIAVFKRLGYLTIVYSLGLDTFKSILACIFIIKRFSLTIDFSIEGLLVGMLIIILSEIFKYGMYLQDEYDTTL